MATAPTALGPINEHSSARVQFTVKDQAAVAIPAADLNAFTLTLYDVATGEILNGRDNQNVLNANGVTVDAAGLVTWLMQPADNAVLNQERTTVETHIALFTFTWDEGHHHYDLPITVRNLARVP